MREYTNLAPSSIAFFCGITVIYYASNTNSAYTLPLMLSGLITTVVGIDMIHKWWEQ